MDGIAVAGLTREDEQHLTWLAYGHYALAALTFVCGLFPMIHLTVGIGLLAGELGPYEPNRALTGGIFVLVAGGLIGMFWAVSAALIYAGRCLRRRVKPTLVFVVAIIQCVFFQPLGLVLGILTILVLTRPAVKAAFQAGTTTPTSF